MLMSSWNKSSLHKAISRRKFARESRHCEEYGTYPYFINFYIKILYKPLFFEISCARFKILLSFFGNVRFSVLVGRQVFDKK